MATISHEFELDDNLPMWHCWHAFRRQLSSTLYALGVDDLMVQRIMRHKDVQTTRDHYIKTTSAQSVAAMAKLEASFSASCADRALAAASVNRALPN